MLQKIGKYEIRSQIGRGAMGTVFEGFDAAIGRRVAIKTLRTELFEAAQLPDLRARFKREAQSAGKLSHPHIVTIHDYGEEAGTPYIVMEYIDGKELGRQLEQGARFPLDDIEKIMTQLLGALSNAHEHGVVHRDLKPSNLFLLPDGALKVVDFGIARVDSSDLTSTGAILGTPAYMSPEQCLGLQVDHRSDLFSAGVILYELLTGDRPFSGSVTSIIQKVLRQEPLPPSELNPTISSAWDRVVARAMAKKPEARFESARQFAAAIKALRQPGAGSAQSGVETQVDDARATLADRDATVRVRSSPKAAEQAPAPPGRSMLWPAIAVVVALAGAAATYVALDRTPTPATVASAANEEQSRRAIDERVRREVAEKLAAQRAAESAAAERAAAQQAAAQQAAAAKRAEERAAAEKAMAAKLAAERAGAAKAAAAKAAADKAAAERAAAARLEAQRAAAAKLAVERAAAEKAAAAQAAQRKIAMAEAAAAKAAAAKEAAATTETPSVFDGRWTAVTSGPFQCPQGRFTVDIKNGNVAGAVQWERTAQKGTLNGYVQSDSAVVIIVIAPEPRAPVSRFIARLDGDRLVGRDTVSCSLGAYFVSLGRS